MTTKISLDGNEISSDTLKELYDRNGDVKINKENKVSSYDYNSEYREWVQDDTNIIRQRIMMTKKEHLLRKTHLNT